MDGEIEAVADGIAVFEEELSSNNYNAGIGVVTMKEDPIDDTHMHKDIGSGDLDLDSITTGAHRIDPFSTILNASGAIDTVGTRALDMILPGERTVRNMILVTDTNREEER